MDISLTKEQIDETLEDGWIGIKKQAGPWIYCEFDRNGGFEYAEYYKPGVKRAEGCFSFNHSDLERLKPKRPNDPSYYSNEPLCPNCRTYMIYKFEYCPRCGQKLDWSVE